MLMKMDDGFIFEFCFADEAVCLIRERCDQNNEIRALQQLMKARINRAGFFSVSGLRLRL